MRVVAVPKRNAESLRQELHAKAAIDRSVRITKRGDEVLIPVTDQASLELARFGARYEDYPTLTRRSTPPDPKRDLEEQLRAPGAPLGVALHRWDRIVDNLVSRASDVA